MLDINLDPEVETFKSVAGLGGQDALNISNLERLIHTTVKIDRWREGKVVGSGTGFFFVFHDHQMEVPLLITNRHIVRDVPELRLTIHLASAANPCQPSLDVIHIEYVIAQVILHPDLNTDLCALPMGPTFNHIESMGRKPFWQPMGRETIPSDWEQFDVVEDVLMVGYPRGLYDKAHYLPLVRKGVTSTSIQVPFCGRREFAVDMACWDGSSGSPVFLYNPNGYFDRRISKWIADRWRLYLIGVLYAGPLFPVGDTKSNVKIPMHVGYIIRADQVKALETPLHEMLENMSRAEKGR